MNNRLELAVGDATNKVGAVNHFQIFMNKLHSVYIANQQRIKGS